MKTIYYYALCITMFSFSVHTMDNDTSKQIRISASICTLAGGWSFFAVNSPRLANKLSAPTKRVPLAVFLIGCSINQCFIIKEIIKNEKKYHE